MIVMEEFDESIGSEDEINLSEKEIEILKEFRKMENFEQQYSFEEYFDKVKSNLYCNSSDYDRENYITYTYTNEKVEEHTDYFKECMDKGLSPYKSLLFFSDYLNEI
jgi:hypothetical protein